MKMKKTHTQAGLPNTAIGLGMAMAGVAAGAAMLWLALSGFTDQRNNELVESYAGQQVAGLNQSMQQLQADLAQLATNPQLQVALNQGGSATMDRMLRYQLADTLAIYTAPPGQAELVRNDSAPLSFAALDMIRRAERGLPVPLEAHNVDGEWRLYGVKPLRASEKAPIGGTLTGVFQLERVINGLPALASEIGQVRLIQQFPGSAEQVLFTRGDGKGEALRLSTSNPAWQIEFTPGRGLSHSSADPLLLVGAALLALLGGLFGMLWLQRSWTRSLRADTHTLTQLTLGHKAAGLRLSPLEPLAQNIMQLVKRSGQTLGASPKREEAAPAPVAAKKSNENLTDPLFQSTEILDIDILDDGDPFAMSDAPEAPAAPSAPALPNEIFRAYDIRGVVGKSLTEENVYWLGRSIGSASIEAGERRVLVARDGRLSGPALIEQLIKGLMESGCAVTDLGMVPTPVLYFATHTTGATSGIMLTGSHNPPAYNGLKIVIAGQTLYGEQISALNQRLRDNRLETGSGSREQLEVLGDYQQYILDDVVMARPLKVVVDCGNGVGGVIAQQLLESIGCQVVPLYCEVDGLFPNHHPDPGKPENLVELINTVKRENADLGVAFDGDADRLGFVTETGEMIYPDRLLMLFAEDIVTRHPGADIIFDVKCTRQLPALINRAGGRPIMWKSGHSLIKAKMKETGALLGGEMSGHVFFKERWFGFDDGLYSACRLLEILSMQPESASEVMARYPAGLTTPEINLTVGEAQKFAIIQTLDQKADWGDGKVTTLDGIRVDFPTSWGLIRASNTTPVLVLRFEAEQPQELERVQQLFREQLQAAAPEVKITF
ncbi:MAG: phosphomannomutase/phosphoglucomutase [Halopseudomonas sp.]|uniref:phosphomannomutase/phosphoglucomutase n=1 Tax=Halopseudomonas sp. TaxID=2901191 RepID=UPI003001B464